MDQRQGDWGQEIKKIVGFLVWHALFLVVLNAIGSSAFQCLLYFIILSYLTANSFNKMCIKLIPVLLKQFLKSIKQIVNSSGTILKYNKLVTGCLSHTHVLPLGFLCWIDFIQIYLCCRKNTGREARMYWHVSCLCKCLNNLMSIFKMPPCKTGIYWHLLFTFLVLWLFRYTFTVLMLKSVAVFLSSVSSQWRRAKAQIALVVCRVSYSLLIRHQHPKIWPCWGIYIEWHILRPTRKV